MKKRIQKKLYQLLTKWIGKEKTRQVENHGVLTVGEDSKYGEREFLYIMASSGHPYIEKSEAAWASKNPSDITLKQAREILKKLPGQLAIQRKNIYSEENHAK